MESFVYYCTLIVLFCFQKSSWLNHWNTISFSSHLNLSSSNDVIFERNISSNNHNDASVTFPKNKLIGNECMIPPCACPTNTIRIITVATVVWKLMVTILVSLMYCLCENEWTVNRIICLSLAENRFALNTHPRQREEHTSNILYFLSLHPFTPNHPSQITTELHNTTNQLAPKWRQKLQQRKK